jgi:hypothetical protein
MLRREVEPPRLVDRFEYSAGLSELLIHHQDIRRAVAAPRFVPEERLLPVLWHTRSSPLLRGAWRTRGVRLVGMDLGWSAGHGLPVYGPVEALLMAMAGRQSALADLVGPGMDRLEKQIGRLR